MRDWILIMSIDGINIDASEIITSKEEPGFWECYEIAEKNGCEWFTVEPVEE